MADEGREVAVGFRKGDGGRTGKTHFYRAGGEARQNDVADEWREITVGFRKGDGGVQVKHTITRQEGEDDKAMLRMT